MKILANLGFDESIKYLNEFGLSEYTKEDGVDVIEMHRDAITEDDVVVLHDDVLATGGTMAAAYELVKSMNPKKIYINFIIELTALNGRATLPADAEVTSLIKY